MMKISRAFCITLTVFMLTLAPLAAQNGSQVIIDAFPKSPSIGERWVLSLLVDHDTPDEVIVSPPVIAPSLSLDSFTKAPRRSGGKTQTSIEYRFIPNAAGAYLIEPLTVTTPSGVTKTAEIFLEVVASAAQSQSKARQAQERPQLLKTFWAGAPARMTAGESAVFTLRLSGANSLLPLQAPPQLFMPEVPPGVILSSLPLSESEKKSGAVLKLNLIPLTGDLRLNARTFQHENLVFEIPPLFVSVSVKVPATVPATVPTIVTVTVPTTVTVTELAELRRNERDHPQGKQFASVRRAAEESLGIFDTKDESRWRRNLLLGLILFIIFFVIVAPFACLMLVRNSFRRRVAFFCAVIIAALSSLYFYRFVDTSVFFKGAGRRFAVTLATPARRTADIDGEELFSFKEGQPVEILLKSDSWLYVQTNDAAANAGWIPAETAVFY